MPAPQRAFQTFTAAPADLHLLQPICRPQFIAYAFTCFLGLIAHPSSLYTGLGLCYWCSCFRHSQASPLSPPQTQRLQDRGYPRWDNDISDRHNEVLKEHYQTLLDTARKKVSGPLPTYRRGFEQFSKLFMLAVLVPWLVHLQQLGLREQMVFILGAASALLEGWASP
ncbi:hypothetical protein AOLI_G00131950 [Acnodon oligacanthus]